MLPALKAKSGIVKHQRVISSSKRWSARPDPSLASRARGVVRGGVRLPALGVVYLTIRRPGGQKTAASRSLCRYTTAAHGGRHGARHARVERETGGERVRRAREVRSTATCRRRAGCWRGAGRPATRRRSTPSRLVLTAGSLPEIHARDARRRSTPLACGPQPQLALAGAA